MNATQPESGAGPDPIARQLVAQAQEIARLKSTVEDLAAEARESVAGLLIRLETVEDQAGSPRAGPVMSWCWRELGPQGAQALWRELTGWVRWIRSRYPLARRIPSCWADHPEVVEELTALWLAWQAAYTEPDASLTAAADWHDRWLPGFLYRLEHGAFALDCSASHRNRPASAYAEPDPPRGPEDQLAHHDYLEESR